MADEETLLAYVDGVNVSALPIEPLARSANPQPVGIGNNAPQFDDGLVGALDRVRIWDEARSVEQLLASSSP